ncbi:hypothetical protein EYC84_002350 [Monilinia fructicola]|uniref:Uncharacterized protein n=1 Tax=Monilinia fructicola TaxID=38448 RepID=A0A5M9JQE3_MONFR|nr:hypothetical protein EYC84_002350 [Monilinia fructicola]
MHDDQKSLNYNLKIINYNLNPDENASRQQVASQASLQQQGSINTIPSEIIQLIMGQLPPYGAKINSVVLPNPCNKGDSWDQDAISIIENDLLRHPNVRDWVYNWSNYWIWERNSLHFTHVTATWAEKLAEIILSEGCYTDWILYDWILIPGLGDGVS